MSPEEFFSTLKMYRWKEPFEPFVIELESGDEIRIEEPTALAFSVGGGGYLATDPFALFKREEVRAIRPATSERIA